MNRDRSKSSKSNRSRQHDPNAATRRTHHRSRRNLPCDWTQGSGAGNESTASIRLAADLLRSSTSGWLAVYLGCIADGTVALHRSETQPPREQMRPHKPRHWICKAWNRVCTSASVARAINPTLWAIIDVLLVAFFVWTIIQACKR
ncbi:MAG: hypothetical protein EBY29_06050 [Planctomycetes bacterium]|nr:hypothetical protein [Planctomycetota bacterium]